MTGDRGRGAERGDRTGPAAGGADPGDPRTELQTKVLEHDWSATALGPQAEWSPTLRTAVGTALNSRFPMLLMWGPELVMIYNDAYAPMLGLRHPAALGGASRDVWADVWPDIEPMVDDVFAGGATSPRICR